MCACVWPNHFVVQKKWSQHSESTTREENFEKVKRERWETLLSRHPHGDTTHYTLINLQRTGPRGLLALKPFWVPHFLFLGNGPPSVSRAFPEIPRAGSDSCWSGKEADAETGEEESKNNSTAWGRVLAPSQGRDPHNNVGISHTQEKSWIPSASFRNECCKTEQLRVLPCPSPWLNCTLNTITHKLKIRPPEQNGLWVSDYWHVMFFRNFPSLFQSLIHTPFSQVLLFQAITQKTTTSLVLRSPDSGFDG